MHELPSVGSVGHPGALPAFARARGSAQHQALPAVHTHPAARIPARKWLASLGKLASQWQSVSRHAMQCEEQCSGGQRFQCQQRVGTRNPCCAPMHPRTSPGATAMEDSGDWLLVRADGSDGNISDDGAQVGAASCTLRRSRRLVALGSVCSAACFCLLRAQELVQLGPSTLSARSAQAGTSNSLLQQEQPQGDESADVTSDEDTCEHEEVKAATVQELHEPELQLLPPDCLLQPDDLEQHHAAGQLCTPDAASSSTADAIAADSSFMGPQPAQRAVQPWPAWLAFLVGPVCAASSAMPDTATEREHGQGNVASWLSSAGEAVDTVVGEVREECAELVELLKQALQAGQDAAAQHARMLRVRFSKVRAARAGMADAGCMPAYTGPSTELAVAVSRRRKCSVGGHQTAC